MTPEHRSLTHRTVGGMLWMSAGKAAYILLQLGVLGVLSRLVSPADFGVVSAAIVVIGLSTIVSQLGLGPAIVQRPQLEQRHLETAFTASVLLGIVLGGLIWLGSPLAAEFMHMEAVTPVLRALAWVFPIYGLGTVSASLLSRDLRFASLANLEAIAYGLGYGVVGISTALMGWGVWALVAGQIAQALVKTAVLLAKHPPSLRLSFERQAFRELAYFGGGFTVARFANYVAVHADNVVTGKFLGPAALGYYGRAYSLMSAPAYAFGTVLDSVLFPAMAKVQHDPRRLGAAYRRGVALIALVVLPLSAGTILLGPEVIRVALGPGWTPAVAPFQILGIGMLFRTSYKMSDSIARSTGAVYRRAWRQILYAGLVVLGSWVGQHWGIIGVAWGALGALTINFVMMAGLSLDVARLTWKEFWAAHRPALLLTLVSFAPVWAATAGSRELGLPALVVVSIAGAVLILACCLLVWLGPAVFLGPDGRWMMDTMRSFVRPPNRGAGPRASNDKSAGAALATPDAEEVR